MIFTASGFARATVEIMARVVGSDGLVLAPSGVSTATFAVMDLGSDTPEVPVASGPLTVASVFYDHLIIDSRWEGGAGGDNVGYNFRTQIPGGYFLNEDHTYRIEVRCVATTGEVFFIIFEYTTLALFTPLPAQTANVWKASVVPWESR